MSLLALFCFPFVQLTLRKIVTHIQEGGCLSTFVVSVSSGFQPEVGLFIPGLSGVTKPRAL